MMMMMTKYPDELILGERKRERERAPKIARINEELNEEGR
jgi:hypothetical protein